MKAPRLTLCACLLLAGGTTPTLAQLSGGVETAMATVAPPALRLSQSEGAPLATAGSTPMTDALAGQSQTARQTMVWAVHPSGLALGLGVEQRSHAFGSLAAQRLSFDPTTRQAGMLMGLSVATGRHSYLTLQTPLLNASVRSSADEWLMPQGARQLRMGLVFQTRNKYADLRQGLRMELSAQTTLSVRPRSGRLGFTLHSSW